MTDACDIRISAVLVGCARRWASDLRWVEAAIPADAVRQRLRASARSQAGENVQAEAYRARLSFGLQS